MSLAELILAYWRYRSTRYVDPTGNLKKELFHIKAAMRPVRRLYGSTSAATQPPAGIPGRDRGADDHRPLSRPAQAAVRAVDWRGGATTAGAALRRARVGANGRALSGALGTTPQGRLRRAYEREPQAVKRWLNEEYPAIQRRAKREKAEIHWGDEMGMRSDHQAGRSYGRRGRTPVIPGTGQRIRCNLLSTITNRGDLCFMLFKERFNGPMFLGFLRRLLRQRKRKVFLIMDRHPVHRAAAVKHWLGRHADRLRLFLLPGYSPDLNPDEYLNQDVKTNALGRRRPSDLPMLMRNVRSYLWSTQRQPEIVQSYFDAEPVRYAAM